MALNVGTELTRRDLQGDTWDRCRVTGYFQVAEGQYEVVLSPVEGFAAPVIATQDSVLKVYSLAGPPVTALDDAPWSTPPGEVGIKA